MEQETRPMTIRDWMITLLVLAIPIVNIIMYLVWACGSSGNVNRKTFCQACLIWFLIIFAVGVVFGVLSPLFKG
jgi:hypothetical protein